MDQDFIRCKITEYTGRAGALRCCGKDAKPALLASLIFLRLQARNCISKLVDVTGELRAAERSVKKMTQKSITFPLAEQHIKNLENERKAAREELEIAGGSIAYVLDLWQRAGATLKDLCNLCNRDYTQVLGEIKEERRDREFSSLIFACNLDFKDPRDRGWLTFDVDAPLTHAVKEFYLREMVGTPEGRAASHRALEECFPGILEDALTEIVDLDGVHRLIDKDGVEAAALGDEKE